MEGKTNKEDECQKTSCLFEEEVSDPELDELLDDALLDFGTAEAKGSENTKEDGGTSGARGGAEGTDALFNDIFNTETQKQFGEMMQSFLDPQMMENIQKISEAASKSGDTEEDKKKFEDTLKETLGGLNKSAGDLQNDIPENELLKLLSDVNMVDIEGDVTEESDLMPMMQGMMKSLLSKDILYPSLKDISTKFPKWLEENKSKTELKDFENYERQLEYMKKICSEFEAEKDGDNDTVKKERFERILDCMQNMQELGYPPKELVGDLPPGFPLGPESGGLPGFLQNAEQCSVM